MNTLEKSNKIIINESFKSLFNAEEFYRIIVGGSNSGKSWAVAQYVVLTAIQNNNIDVFCFLKEGNKLPLNLIPQINLILDSYGLDKFVKRYNKTNRILEFKNGSKITFVGLDDPMKIKGALYNIAWMEESDAFSLEDLRMISNRCRKDKKGFKNHVILTFNPTTKAQAFINYFKDNSITHYYNHTTYLDNAMLSEDTIKQFTMLYGSDEYYTRVYINGEFFDKPLEGRFYNDFNYNVKKVTATSLDVLYLSFDFNYLPHSALIISVFEDGVLKIIDEIALKYPENTLEHTLNVFIKNYSYVTEVKVVGDPSGWRYGPSHDNLFGSISKFFKEKRVFCIVIADKAAPSLIDRRLYINSFIFNGDKVIIDTSCKNLINDLSIVLVGNDGTKVKERAMHKELKKGYEKSGHFSDAFDYLIYCVFRSEYDSIFTSIKSRYSVKPTYNPNSF